MDVEPQSRGLTILHHQGMLSAWDFGIHAESWNQCPTDTNGQVFVKLSKYVLCILYMYVLSLFEKVKGKDGRKEGRVGGKENQSPKSDLISSYS